MRRIDVIGIGIGVFLLGGGLYVACRLAGLDTLSAGIWSQVFFLAGLIGWVLSYLWRVTNSNMTYNQQLKDYEEAVLQKRLEEMTPAEIAALQTQLEADHAASRPEESEVG
jgi:membrane protein implicated in regulation of membrane protease activity